jgi:hypothetical protein
MAVIEGGVSAALVGVGAEAGSALHIVAKPTPFGALGSYRFSGVTGTMAAALAAGGQVFYLRWTDATRFAVIHYVKVDFQALTLFTAATLTDFGFDLHKATSVSAGGGGTDLFNALNPTRMRSSMAQSLIGSTSGTARISTTAALTALTALDTYPIAQSLGDSQRVNVAAGTEEQRVNDPTLLFQPNIGDGEHPLVLAQNEGIVVRNRAAWPAAGTGIFRVEVAWSEVTAY